MMKKQTIGTIALGAVFVGAMVHYAFFQPFIPGAASNSLPPETRSKAYCTASLEELFQSPMGSQMDEALRETTLRKLLESNPWTPWIASSEIAISSLPVRRSGESQKWVVASWVGWRSPWLRWKLEGTRNDRLRFLGKHSIWPVWQYASPAFEDGTAITFALTDNLLLACLSDDPADITYLLDVYDKLIATGETP